MGGQLNPIPVSMQVQLVIGICVALCGCHEILASIIHNCLQLKYQTRKNPQAWREMLIIIVGLHKHSYGLFHSEPLFSTHGVQLGYTLHIRGEFWPTLFMYLSFPIMRIPSPLFVLCAWKMNCTTWVPSMCDDQMNFVLCICGVLNMQMCSW